ncbi:MAG: hypothetical protein KBA26_03915 [Candidatus Delongbacteria bacterium]|nr:hypothetical protein [Candidatus Delongbacteria bacterium]
MKLLLRMIMIMAVAALSIQAQDSTQTEKEEFKEYKAYKAAPSSPTFNTAMNYYQQKTTVQPQDYSAWIMQAYLCNLEMERVIELLQTNLDSLNSKTKFSLANLLLSLKEYDKSIAIYDNLNQTTPKWSCPWRHKGEAYMEKGNLVESEKALQQAIVTRITHYDAYIMLAEVQKRMGKYQEAMKTFETGLSYKFKDIEDPEEEVNPINELFLHLELLKLNKQEKSETYQKIYKSLKEKAPGDARWEKF